MTNINTIIKNLSLISNLIQNGVQLPIVFTLVFIKLKKLLMFIVNVVMIIVLVVSRKHTNLFHVKCYRNGTTGLRVVKMTQEFG